MLSPLEERYMTDYERADMGELSSLGWGGSVAAS